MGRVTGLYISARKGADKLAVEQAELITGHGLRGDSHAGRDARRQVSLFSAETLRALRDEGFTVAPEQISSNLFVEAIKLDGLQVGDRLRVGATELEIVERRIPCRVISRIDKRLPKRLYGRCGQLARIVQGGTVAPGDPVEVLSDERQPELF